MKSSLTHGLRPLARLLQRETEDKKIIRRALFAIALAFALACVPSRSTAAPAWADLPPIRQFPPFAVGYITTTSATSFVKPPVEARRAGQRNAQWLVGIQAVSATSQTATLTCYDNASAASGQVVAIEVAMSAGQQVTFPYPGIPLNNGLTCISSAIPTGSGFQIQYL